MKPVSSRSRTRAGNFIRACSSLSTVPVMVAISPTWAESMVARLRRSIQLVGRWKRRSRIVSPSIRRARTGRTFGPTPGRLSMSA